MPGATSINHPIVICGVHPIGNPPRIYRVSILTRPTRERQPNRLYLNEWPDHETPKSATAELMLLNTGPRPENPPTLVYGQSHPDPILRIECMRIRRPGSPAYGEFAWDATGKPRYGVQDPDFEATAAEIAEAHRGLAILADQLRHHGRPRTEDVDDGWRELALKAIEKKRRNPGLSWEAIARPLGMSLATLRRHRRALEAEDFLSVYERSRLRQSK